jgi:hypothetical protein
VDAARTFEVGDEETTHLPQPKRKSPTDRRTQLLKLYPLGFSICWKKSFATIELLIE